MSMTPAREAIRAGGGRGADDFSSGRVSTPELSPERIEELASIRALLEPEMAARALPRAHFALIDRLAAINALNAEAALKQDATAYVRTNLAFHPHAVPARAGPGDAGDVRDGWLQLAPRCGRSMRG